MRADQKTPIFFRRKGGEHNWRGDVERTVQHHIVLLQNQARRVVEEDRFEILALKNYPGMVGFGSA